MLLGVFFIFLGHLHLTPQFFPEYHNHLKNEFGKFNKEFPLHRQTGWRPFAKNYRLGVGIAEILCGGLLILEAGPLQILANVVLLAMSGYSIMTFKQLNYKIEYIASATLVSLLLAALLYMRLSVRTTKTSRSTTTGTSDSGTTDTSIDKKKQDKNKVKGQ